LVGFPWAFASYSDSDEQRDWSIPLDIVRDGDNLTATASLPVVKPESIDVTI
jgi:HSP20 family molecular chaperone IbpA